MIVEMRNSSRPCSMQLIIVALNPFRTDSTSFHQMTHKFWIQHFRFFSKQIFNKLYFRYISQWICTTAMLKCIKIHQPWVKLQSRKTMNLSRNVVEYYILVTLRKKYNKSVSVVFTEVNCFSNELGMKWYKLFKRRCQCQTLFSAAVFYVITYCCVPYLTFHGEKYLTSILCFVMFLLSVVIYFHINDDVPVT